MIPPRDIPRLADLFASAYATARCTDPDRPLERTLEVLFAIDDENRRLAAGEVLPQLLPAAPRRNVFGRRVRSAAQLWLPLIEEVAHHHGLTLKDLTGPSRIRAISSVRQEAMWRMTRQEHVSLSIAAAALNRRDHTCVFYGVEKFEERLAEDPALRARMGVAGKAAA